MDEIFMTFKDQNHFLNYICFIFIHLANKTFSNYCQNTRRSSLPISRSWNNAFCYGSQSLEILQKSYKREKLQNFMKLVSTVSPSNFEHRLRTSLEGIATLSLAHAKNKSQRLEIRNIANVNTRQMKTRSQRNFCYKNTILYQKKSETIENLKR